MVRDADEGECLTKGGGGLASHVIQCFLPLPAQSLPPAPSFPPRFVTFIVVFVINFLARARLSRSPLPSILLARMPNISRGTYVDVACLPAYPSAVP